MISQTICNEYDGIIWGAIQLPWYQATTTAEAQKYVDNEDTGARYYYGTYRSTIYADHNYQHFIKLKDIKINDIIYIYDRKAKTIKKYECISIEVYKVAKSGHIFDEDGNYMGDKYHPDIILVTCKGKDRLVTVWHEVLFNL